MYDLLSQILYLSFFLHMYNVRTVVPSASLFFRDLNLLLNQTYLTKITILSERHDEHRYFKKIIHCEKIMVNHDRM